MSQESLSSRRQTIKIKLPRKPAAPRHSAVVKIPHTIRIFPATKRERWGLILFPFRAYIVVGPLFFFFWDLATTGHRFRTDYVAAATLVALGFICCLGVFIISGLILLLMGRRSDAITNFAFAILVFIIFMLWLPLGATS